MIISGLSSTKRERKERERCSDRRIEKQRVTEKRLVLLSNFALIFAKLKKKPGRNVTAMTSRNSPIIDSLPYLICLIFRSEAF